MKIISLQILLILILTLFQMERLFAQEPAKDNEALAVQQVIAQLFDAMRTGDTTSLRQLFHEEVRLQTVLENPQTKTTRILTESIDHFVKQIGTPHTEVYDERILNYEIKIDRSMATVWTPYRFYVGDKFSHCGVNAFQLVKTAEGWKIVQIIDTRRKEDCEN